jgi:tRNA (adenine57-N1/adenine58-N1)-methyltransferase
MLKIKEDHRHMFTYDTKNLIREGDIALVYENMFLTKQIKIKRGEKYQTNHGLIQHDSLIDFEQYGTKVYTTNKRHFVHILRPSTDLYTRSLSQRTQILYTPDIS